MSKIQQHEAFSVQFLGLFVLATVLIVSLACLLALMHPAFGAAPASDASLILAPYRSALSPKPTERLVFLSLLVLAPMGCMAIVLAWFRKLAPRHPVPASMLPVLLCMCLAMLLFPFVTYGFEHVPDMPGVISRHAFPMMLATTLGATLWHFRQEVDGAKTPSVTLTKSAANLASWILFGAAVALQTFGWRVIGENSIAHNPFWSISAEAAIYAVSQVAAGKTLLVDLPSQYGLFPEFLLPVFKLFGLSVLNFTLLCASLQLAALSALYTVVHRSVRDHALRLAYGLALVALTFGTLTALGGLNDPYFQYWPVRFFWPAIAVWLFYRYSNRPTMARAFWVSSAGAIGALWNADTGLVVWVAFAGVLTAKWIALRTAGVMDDAQARRNILLALGQHALVFAAVASVIFLWLQFKSGTSLQWQWLFGSQKIFYGMGYMMMPLPLYTHPWMSVMGLYLLAILAACRGWATQPESIRADLLAFVGLLGLGLFVYYEGRSHDQNLISVSWPAITVLALLADQVSRSVRACMLSRVHLALPIAALSVLMFCASGFIAGIPAFWANARYNFDNRNSPIDPVVADELQFIRQHTQPGQECLILSRLQGIYHASTGTSSPISGPGLIEIILQADRDAFVKQLQTKPINCMFVGVLPANTFDLGVTRQELPPNMVLAGSNKLQTMLFFRPAPGR